MNKLSYLSIARFWLPLSATWLMMTLEGSFLAAVIARLAEPKLNLAAYGIAFSLALIVEAPVIMILSASVALVTDRPSFLKLRRFTYVLCAAATLVMLVCVIPAVFHFIAQGLIGLPADIALLTHTTMLIMIPWPAAIGYRRFYQGILIRSDLTRRVAYGTVIRLCTMATAGLVLYGLAVKGACVGGAALTVGVVCEAVASRLMVHVPLRRLDAVLPEEGAQETLTYRSILEFYFPLALTSFLTLGVHPILTFFIGKSRFAIESFAVLPVVNSLGLIFRSVGLSYQEVGVALMGKRFEGYAPLRNFAWMLGVGVVAGLGLVAFTPLANVWFGTVSGLSDELIHFAYRPTQIMVLLPGLTVWISFQRAVLICGKATGAITWATAIEVAAMVAVLFAAIYFLDMIGVMAAALAYLIGRIGANLYLIPACRRVLSKGAAT